MKNTPDEQAAAESLPPALQAWLDLRREIQAPSMGRYTKDYLLPFFLCLCYGFIAWLYSTPESGNQASTAVLFFGMLTIVFSVQGVMEMRAERRWTLLLKMLTEERGRETIFPLSNPPRKVRLPDF